MKSCKLDADSPSLPPTDAERRQCGCAECAPRQPTHFTWSVEKDDRCPVCDGVTLLVVAPQTWTVTDGQRFEEYIAQENESAPDHAEVTEEITGHWCPRCSRLVSLSLNT